jgi:phytoene synthase
VSPAAEPIRDRRDLRQAYRACAELTRREAKNFWYALLFLPRHKRLGIAAVYAFSRRCDDIADSDAPEPAKRAALARCRDLLAEAYLGAPEDPVFAALGDAAVRFRVPKVYFDELILGVESDLAPRRFDSFSDLRGYCYRVASVVGLICLRVFGYDDEAAEKHAVVLGVGMQLVNILRDLGEDAARGRVYLPLEDLRRFGYGEEDLRRGVLDARFRDLMRFEIARAREHLDRGERMLAYVHADARYCPAALAAIYRRVLRRIEARGYDVFSERVTSGGLEKLCIAGGAWARAKFTRRKTEPRA